MRHADQRSDGQAGLTLIEVLVAIAILAVAVGTFLSLLSLQARNAVGLDERAMARIVAENALVTAVVDIEAERPVTAAGRTEMGAYSFDWAVARTPAPFEGLAILTVSVRPEGQPQRLSAHLSTLTEAER